MKYILTILTFAVLLSACGGETAEMEHPQDLAGKKALLKAKKTEVRSLTKDIEQLEAEIEELEPAKEKPRVLVTTQAVKPSEFKRYVEIQGTVQSDDYVMASSDVGGRIIDLKVQEGQPVQKGALIAKLDLEQLDKQIAEVETSLQLANEVYERQKRLWDQNIGSEMQLLQAENNKERLEKSLETIRFQQTKSNVYAPISGVVEMVMTKAGEIAGPGAPIVQILNTNKVKVVAAVPENYLTAVRKGEVVTVKFPALDREEKARVSLIGRTINAANRTFEVEVNMNNSNGSLKPNLLAMMLINDFSAKDAIAVPIELVQQEVSGKDFVFVKAENEDGAIAKKVYVETGESYEGQIIITEGLKGGEELIVAGARSLSDNELIEVDTTAPTKKG